MKRFLSSLLIVLTTVANLTVLPAFSQHLSLTGAGNAGGCTLLTDNDSSNKSASFTAASSQKLSVADNSNVSVGDIDFSICAFVSVTDQTGFRSIVSKYDSDGGGDREYILTYNSGTDRFQFIVYTTGDVPIATVVANTFGAVDTGVHFVCAGHDKDDDTQWISVDAGTVDTLTTAGVAPQDDAAAFSIGGNAAGYYANGIIDSVGLWKRDVRSNISTLYNSGAGLRYCQLTSALRTSLSGWWDLGEATAATRADSVNSSNLTDSNSVVQGSGLSTGSCVCQ